MGRWGGVAAQKHLYDKPQFADFQRVADAGPSIFIGCRDVIDIQLIEAFSSELFNIHRHNISDVISDGQMVLNCNRVSRYGTQYHTCMAHGRFERTIGQKCTLYANYVPNRPRSNLLRDPNHSLRIEYALR